MSALQDFLLETPVEEIKEQVEISVRLKGKPFTITAMSGSQFSAYQQASTQIRKGKKLDFDNKKFKEMAVINHTSEPNFKDAEFIKKAGCVTPEQLLNKVLLAGEISELAQRISALSGFDQDMDDLVDEAKNS